MGAAPGGVIRIKGHDHIPFKDKDIADIVVTHDKWNFEGQLMEQAAPSFSAHNLLTAPF